MALSARRILIFTPVFPKANKGASEQDQIYGALHLQSLGHSIRMAAFLPEYQAPAQVRTYAQTLGLDVAAFPYSASGDAPRRPARRLWAALRKPALIDGAAYQHAHPALLQFVRQQIEVHNPEIVWLDNTFLWPLAALAKSEGIPVIIRSQNFEPNHLLDESKLSITNGIRYAGKYLGELAALRVCTVLAAITPIEQAIYRRLDSRVAIELVPLRGLPYHLRPGRAVSSRRPLNVFFAASTYHVSHNRAALAFIIEQVVPRLRDTAPGEFRMHIYGGKVPDMLQRFAADDMIIHGFVPNLESALAHMDIALAPSLYGCGMQQKVFEPLCRGFPTISSERGLAGYPFVPGQEVLLANTAGEIVAHLMDLRDPKRRAFLAANAYRRASELFSIDRQNAAHERLIQRALSVHLR